MPDEIGTSKSSKCGHNEFLGRGFVPITLVVAVIALGIALALSADALGFLLVSLVIAFALTLRYTWHKRGQEHYGYIMIAFLFLHLALIIVFRSDFSRAAGGLYMLGAFGDALVMTTLVNILVGRNSNPSS